MFYIGGLPALLALFMMRLMPESPRWLASRGRMDAAKATLIDIEARVQRATCQPLPPVVDMNINLSSKRASWSDLFQGIYAKRTIVLWICWFATYLAN
ncbi:MAG: major facilitator superfamily protein, partial [Hyphomicrobiales bacterium]|nr:major facilitator superfamily protein [Hyphomicrobiales bacterium]